VPRRAFSRSPLLPGRGPLARAHPAAAFLIVLALFGLGVWLRGPLGAGLLGLLALGLLGLLASTWRLLTTGQRAGRVLVVLLLAVIAVSLLH